jgi:DNA replicative helicase MCM subunit Mcm2 (Cdc46/Mcm family)
LSFVGDSVATGRGKFLSFDGIATGMQSVRKGLRAGEIEKDTYERLTCSDCGEELETRNDPEEIGKLRACPECGREWKEVG